MFIFAPYNTNQPNQRKQPKTINPAPTTKQKAISNKPPPHHIKPPHKTTTHAKGR